MTNKKTASMSRLIDRLACGCSGVRVVSMVVILITLLNGSPISLNVRSAIVIAIVFRMIEVRGHKFYWMKKFKIRK